jgi:hypothetical protein
MLALDNIFVTCNRSWNAALTPAAVSTFGLRVLLLAQHVPAVRIRDVQLGKIDFDEL